MKITIQYTNSKRKKPAVGDRRTTKRYGLQIRVIETDYFGHWVRNGSRYRYEWCKPEQLLYTPWQYLVEPWMLKQDPRLPVES